MKTTHQQLADKVKALTVFLIENQGRCFERGLEAAKLFKFVAFNLLNGCVFTAFDKSGRVQMVVIAWRDDAMELLRRNEAQEPQFTWQTPRLDGDAILIDAVVGNRKWLPEIYRQVTEHWPDSPRRRLFTRRRKTLVELNWKTIQRLNQHGKLAQHS